MNNKVYSIGADGKPSAAYLRKLEREKKAKREAKAKMRNEPASNVKSEPYTPNLKMSRLALSGMSIETDLRSSNSPLSTNRNTPFPVTRESYNQSQVLNRLNCTLQYPDYISWSDFNYLFMRHPLGNNICTTMPSYTWNPRPIVLEQDNDTGIPKTPFELACAEIAKKVDLFGQIERADVCAQVGQYGLLYVSYNDRGTGKKIPKEAKKKYKKGFKNPSTLEKYTYWSEPIYLEGLGEVNWKAMKGMGVNAINYVVPYMQPNAWPTQYISTPSEPSFSLVAYYNLQSGGQVFGAGANSSNIVYGASLPVTWNVVHASRCIHIIERAYNNNILGTPALEPVYNDILNDIRVTGGSSMVYQYNARGGLAISNDQKENQGLTDEERDDFKLQVQNYLAGYTRTLMLDGLKVAPINLKVDPIDKQAQVFFQKISAGSKIPLRIMLGNEQGKLASDQDTKKFDAIIQIRKEGYANQLVRRFFDPLIKNEVIPKPNSGAYKLHFPTLDVSDDTSNATTFGTTITALAALGNSKSTDVEKELPAFIKRAKEITKTSSGEIDLPNTPDNYSRPDLRVDDMAELRGDDEEYI